MTTGERIRLFRQAHGYSQLRLAQAAGITQDAISEIERDLREPLLGTAARIAHALNVATEAIVDNADDDPELIVHYLERFVIGSKPQGYPHVGG